MSSQVPVGQAKPACQLNPEAVHDANVRALYAWASYAATVTDWPYPTPKFELVVGAFAKGVKDQGLFDLAEAAMLKPDLLEARAVNNHERGADVDAWCLYAMAQFAQASEVLVRGEGEVV